MGRRTVFICSRCGERAEELTPNLPTTWSEVSIKNPLAPKDDFDLCTKCANRLISFIQELAK